MYSLLAETRNARSLPFPGRLQEAERDVNSIADSTDAPVELTTLSSPTSNVAGSGIGPSITHRFDSYLVRIKFSILLSMFPLALVYCCDGEADSRFRGDVTRCQFGFPVSANP